jgi:hypothetical protein
LGSEMCIRDRSYEVPEAWTSLYIHMYLFMYLFIYIYIYIYCFVYL